MTIPNDLDFREGQQISASALQYLADVAMRNQNVSSGGDGTGYSAPGGVAYASASAPRWWIAILGQASASMSHLYSWTRVRRNYAPDPAEWQDHEEGPSGTYDDLPAREVNNHQAVPVGTVVEAWISDDGQSLEFQYDNGGNDSYTNYHNQVINVSSGSTVNNNSGSTVNNISNTTNFTGTASVTTAPGTAVNIGGAILYPPASSTPTNIGGNTNNFALINASIQFVNVTVDADFTGIEAGADGRRLIMINYGAATLNILHESTASNAANRIHCPYGQDVVFPTRFAAEFQYDGVISRWRLLWVSDILNPGVGQTTTISTDQHNHVFDRGKPSLAFDLGDNVDLTGLAGGVKGYILHIAVIHTTPGLYTLTVKHLSGSSLLANRIVTPYGKDFKVLSGGGMTVYYDGALWRILATRDIFVEWEIVYGGTDGVPTSSPDFIREEEGVVQQNTNHDTDFPIHRLMRYRDAGASVESGDVIGAWVGSASVEDTETDLAMVQAVYQDGGAVLELWGHNGTDMIRGFRIMTSGHGMFDEADMPEELLGTDAGGEVVNISIGDGLILEDDMLSVDPSGIDLIDELDELIDVVITGPIAEQVLIYNGTEWVNDFLNLEDLGNVDPGSPNNGDVLVYHSASGKWISASAPGGGTGTVTAVALSMPGIFSVAGSPITTAGTFTVTLATQTANTVFAGPTTGSAAAPTFRALVGADIPAGILSLDRLVDITSDRLLGRDTAGTGSVEQLTVTGGLEFTGLGGIQRSALTGHVTASAGSNSTTIADGVVTPAKMDNGTALSVLGRSANSSGVRADIAAANDGEVLRRSGTTVGFGTIAAAGIGNGVVSNAKLADMTTRTIKGRKTGSTGAPEDCTLSEVLDFITSAAQGDLLFRGSSTWQRLAAGTALQLLRTGGAAADPAWAFPDMRSLVSVVCRAFRNYGSLTVNNATWTTVTLNGENYDTNSIHSTVSNTERLTVPSGMGGAWFLWVECNPQYVSGGINSQIRIEINGGALTETTVSSGITSTLVYVQTASAGDYFSASIRQSSGSSQTFPSGGGYVSVGALFLGVV